MKNKVKIASLLLAIAGLSGCEINDPVNDWADLGQQTAYVYWELKDAVNAGNDLDFRVYYYADGSTIEKAQAVRSIVPLHAHTSVTPIPKARPTK